MSDLRNSAVSIVQRDRSDVIRQISEITNVDNQSINQTIEACMDDAGHYSMDQVISLLLDDNTRTTGQAFGREAHDNSSASLPKTAMDLSQTSNHRIARRITAGVDVQFPSDTNPMQSVDADLERAILSSFESVKQSIDESDIAERNPVDEPVGLRNIGNTCWFNSVIQTLYTLPYFRHLILNFKFSEENSPSDSHEKKAIDFTKNLRQLFVLMLKSPRRSIDPEPAIRSFNETGKLSGVNFSQEDCSEFAIHLIDLIELGFEIRRKNLENALQSSNSDNPVHSFVTGEVEVKRHGHEPTHEAFRQINISILDSTNLYDALEAFWLRRINEEPSDHQDIVEQRWLKHLPPVLFICLNRYRFSQATKQASKLVIPFEFYRELYLDRYMLANENLILNKRETARTLLTRLHDLESQLDSYLKYPCNNGSILLSDAIRVVYEYATGNRLDPVLVDRTVSDTPTVSQSCSIRPSPTTSEDLRYIQTLLPSWLTEIENRCAVLREEIHRLKQQLKQLYDIPELTKTKYALHAVCVHQGSAAVGHFWTYVYHADKQKWYQYNDKEVTESKWDDVIEAGIGQQQDDQDEQHVPSAYLLVYIDPDKSLFNDASCLLTPELHRTLDNDLQSLKEQTDKFQFEKLDKNLEDVTTQIRNHHIVDRISTLPIFTDPNMFFDREIVDPVIRQVMHLLKINESKLSLEKVDLLLREIVDAEINAYVSSKSEIMMDLPKRDHRLEHILSYFIANDVNEIYQRRVMFDIIRRLPIERSNVRLTIFQSQAQLTCRELQMSDDEIEEYQDLIADYKNFRGTTAAFVAGCRLMAENKYKDAIAYFCLACEYHLNLSRHGASPMKSIDQSILFKTRQLCFQKWNEIILSNFRAYSNYNLNDETHHILSCLSELKISSDDDQTFVSEIQEVWYSLLDQLQPSVRSASLEAFLERLLEQPTDQHQHHLSIKTDHLVERYQTTIQELFHQYPTLRHRLDISSVLLEPIQIPITINRSDPHDRQLTENDGDRSHSSL
ncbi:unnamed protein product [Adineta ricciae]|uniref:USP domain-containing protein n=1 Tax=Adineta ricciae TaxID=249248 RepID=A0A814KWP8_ADIRI|nr:unnamed protein product [Adineta ricciae]CAF1094434.1 unnamed protein product [Adineta ricciae]